VLADSDVENETVGESRSYDDDDDELASLHSSGSVSVLSD